jgi:hypothetical protein
MKHQLVQFFGLTPSVAKYNAYLVCFDLGFDQQLVY